MTAATISTNGQLVIPLGIRKAVHLEAGEKVSFTFECERLVRGKFGRPVLLVQASAPPMTPERVAANLDELA